MKLRILTDDENDFMNDEMLMDDNNSAAFMGVSAINQQDLKYSSYASDSVKRNKKAKSRKKNVKQRYNTSRRNYG